MSRKSKASVIPSLTALRLFAVPRRQSMSQSILVLRCKTVGGVAWRRAGDFSSMLDRGNSNRGSREASGKCKKYSF